MSDPTPANRVAAPAEIVDPDQLIRVEDGLLVVPSGCVLPQICVLTNEPVSANDMILTNLFWCPPAMLPIVLIFSPAMALISFFLSHDYCEITYGLSPSIRRWSIFRRATCSLLAITMLVTTTVLAAALYSPWLFVPTGILFLVTLIGAVAGPSHLTVAKCRNGMYWIKGLRADFLSQLPLEA